MRFRTQTGGNVQFPVTILALPWFNPSFFPGAPLYLEHLELHALTKVPSYRLHIKMLSAHIFQKITFRRKQKYNEKMKGKPSFVPVFGHPNNQKHSLSCQQPSLVKNHAFLDTVQSGAQVKIEKERAWKTLNFKGGLSEQGACET